MKTSKQISKDRVLDLIERFRNESEFEDEWDVFDATFSFFYEQHQKLVKTYGPISVDDFQDAVLRREKRLSKK